MRPGDVNNNYFPLFFNSQTHVSRHLAPCNPWKWWTFVSGPDRFGNRLYLYIKGNFLFLGVNKTVKLCIGRQLFAIPISILIWFKMKVNYVLWNWCHKRKLEYSVWKFIGPSCVLFICVSVVQRNVNTQHFIRKHKNNRLFIVLPSKGHTSATTCVVPFIADRRFHLKQSLRWTFYSKNNPGKVLSKWVHRMPHTMHVECHCSCLCPTRLWGLTEFRWAAGNQTCIGSQR